MPPFTLSAGNELAHALTALLASDAGIRALSIKGFVTDRYGLREARVAADADVLIEPARFDEFCELLAVRGWHPRHERPVPSLIGQHSVAYIHEDWPNDIDVHLFFPGFLGPRDAAFEALWSSRRTMSVAHRDAFVPSRAGAAVITALHALRYSHSDRHSAELATIKRVLLDDFDLDERAECVEIARRGGALWVMREVLTEMGAEPEIDATAAQQRTWELNRATVEDGSAVSWLAALRDAPCRTKPKILFQALWISRDDIPRNDAAQFPAVRDAWAHRRMRWRRGAAALAHYLRLRGRI